MRVRASFKTKVMTQCALPQEAAPFHSVSEKMILACYECRLYLEEEERLLDRKLEECCLKKNAGPRRYDASYNFKRRHSKFGEDFHQYMIQNGIGTAKTRKEIRETYQKVIEEPADGI